jgi:hypothetical protein
MLLDIVLMLLATFGVSRVLLNFLPVSVTAKSRVAFANIGSLFVIALLYGIAVITAPDIAAILLVGIPVAAACQALWYWRDISKLPSSEGSYTTAPRNSIDGEVDPFRGKIERWEALVRYDDEICAAAEQLRCYGDTWVRKLGESYFALNEDRRYLPNIVSRLVEEAERDKAKAESWAAAYRQTANGQQCTNESLDILRQAQARGYTLRVEKDKTFTATKNGGTSFLRSNNDIRKFAKFAKMVPSNSMGHADDDAPQGAEVVSFRNPMSFPKGATLYRTKGPLVAVLADGSVIMDSGGLGGRVFVSEQEYRKQTKDWGAWATHRRF